MNAKSEKDIIVHEFSLVMYRMVNYMKKSNPSSKGIELIEQADFLIRKYSNPLDALRSENIETVGSVITEAITLHELNPDTVSSELKLRGNTLSDLMNDNVYTNCIPIILFRNLIVSLHIPFSRIEAAMLPTFHLLVSKETPDSISKKSGFAPLWENEESIGKYTDRLKELMNPLNPS